VIITPLNTTKIQIFCDAGGTPLRCLLSAGQASNISDAHLCWTKSAIPQANLVARKRCKWLLADSVLSMVSC